MNKILLAFLFLLVIGLGFSQREPGPVDSRFVRAEYGRLDHIYRAAEALSGRPDYNDKTEAEESRMNREALEGFTRLLPLLDQLGEDSLAFFCWLKTGTLYHYFDSLEPAQHAYREAITRKAKLPNLPDSFVFKPLVFSGGIYYNQTQFDSALASYQAAEKIAAGYPVPLSGSNRLFNTLGAVYYETGNYSQARNYFEKAIAVLPPGESAYADLLANYKVNLASTLNKLELYEEAQAIYAALLPLNRNRTEILHNLGAIRSAQREYREAIAYFRQVSYSNNKMIRLCNDMASAWLQLHQPDSARYWINRAMEENKKWNGDQKNTPHGLTLRYAGDAFAAAGDPQQALRFYQQALMQFDREFNDSSLTANPQSFEVVFSYIQLFQTLIAKAESLEQVFNASQKRELLESALAAYRSAFDLADYVEKTYDSDEARLFLNRIKYTVHGKPIDLSLRLYEQTNEKKFLEQAYVYDQQNKASILSLNVQENQLRETISKDNSLLQREAQVKSAITRLSLRAPQLGEGDELTRIQGSIRDLKIRLGKIQDSINQQPAFRKKMGSGRVPDVASLQKMLDDKTALISYHLSPGLLTIFLITPGRFEFVRLPIDSRFFAAIDHVKQALAQTGGSERYSGNPDAARLYQYLVKPLAGWLKQSERLILIPDDELNYLPFEALVDEQEQYLVEHFSVQYQYSTSLLDTRRGDGRSAERTLAMAPFASQGATDSAGLRLSALPASRDEVVDLDGEVISDAAATRENFLTRANHYGILHLATHAAVNNEAPLRSYIAFYPRAGQPNLLYAAEIYDLHLDSTRLVILTACETGTGQLVRGEGLMSLSRAFTYAGCPNIITSLWKAEDKTTALLARALHHYLAEGYSRDLALRQAKLDLLHDEQLDPRFKSPAAWAHLVLIGEYEPARRPFPYRWLLLLPLGALLLFLLKKIPSRLRRDGRWFSR